MLNGRLEHKMAYYTQSSDFRRQPQILKFFATAREGLSTHLESG